MGTVLIHRVDIMTERGKKIGYPITLLQPTVLQNDTPPLLHNRVASKNLAP